MLGAFERVYELGPVFRAEPRDIVRQLALTREMPGRLCRVRRPPPRGGADRRTAGGRSRDDLTVLAGDVIEMQPARQESPD